MSMEKPRSEERKGTQARIPLSDDQLKQVSGGDGSGITFPNDFVVTFPINDSGSAFLVNDFGSTYTPDTSGAGNVNADQIGWPTPLS